MYLKLTIVGHLGHDPELRYTPSGQAVCNYNVATSRRWRDNNGQQQEETIWIRVSTWGKQAELDNQYLQKGNLVLCEGRLTPDRQTNEPRIWTDRDGNPRAGYDMTAFTVRYLGGRGDSGGGGGGGYRDSGSAGGPGPAAGPGPSGGGGDDYPVTEDEIPF